jgi:hypothetical protein
VWVDDHDFQIVKTYGKTVPDIRKKHGEEENLFPKFTTWRQQIDGQFFCDPCAAELRFHER